jgi:iron complex outermembrane receptor protein
MGHSSARRGAAALAIALSQLARAEGEEARPVELEEAVVPRAPALPDSTAAATVVDAKQFGGELKSVAELTATAPGVAIHDYGGLGQLSTVSIRGSDASGVRVLLDGIPIDTAAGGGVDLSSIPLHWISRVEVVRGAEGAYFGAGALAGAVNVVTLPVVPGAWNAQFTGGSFGTYGGEADVGVGGERWALLAAASGLSTTGDFPFLFPRDPAVPGSPLLPRVRENDASAQGGLLVKGRWTPGADRFDGLVQLSWSWRELPGVPANPTPNDWQRGGRATAALRWTRCLPSGVLLQLGATARLEDLDLWLAPPSGSGAVLQHDGAGGVEAKATWDAGPSSLTAGALASAEELDSTGTGVHSRPTFAAWANDDISLAGRALRVSPALRVDAVGAFQGVSGKLGASATVAGPLSLRASVGHSFRPPSFSELYLQYGFFQPNPSLAPEQAWSVDGALVYDGPLGRASAGPFFTLYQDVIVYDTGVAPGSFKPFNFGKASAAGAEVEVATVPARALYGLQGQLAYTFMATEELLGVPGVLGSEIPHRPRNRFYARASLDGGLAGGNAEVQYVGSQFLDSDNLQSVPASFAVNAGAFVRILRSPEVRLTVEVKNLLDNQTLEDGFGYPLPSRTFLATLRVGSPKEN